MSAAELPPSYNDAITGFVPPPEYQHSLSNNGGSSNIPTPLPTAMSREEYYQPKKLNLVMLDDFNEDPRDVDLLDIPTDEYIVKSDDELQDLYHSMYTIVEDKYVQVSRNTDFINKKIRSMYNHYYINNLRNNTLADFLKIKAKLQKELESLPQMFQYYKQFNQIYETVSNELNVIKYELENAIEPDEKSTLTEGDLLNLSSQMNTKSNLLKKCKFNLKQINDKVQDLNDSEEVSYVLKERARVYNLATDFVRNQQ